jgi:hypothetical protein
MCNRVVKLKKAKLQYNDFIMYSIFDIPLDRYITIDCDCMCVYDEDMDLIAFSRDFISNYGKS